MSSACHPLPIVPADVLQRFHVAEPMDTRFTGCARLLQSIWRERRELAMGRYQPTNGKARKLGSRLPPSVARTGVNFLAADIAKCARREAAYREIGALIDEQRLWGNLLSSQALTFNLFARAKLDPEYATRLCRAMLPNHIETVHSIAFEHSPGRGDPAYLGDRTAFDLIIMGETQDGTPAFLAIEVKYAEQFRQQMRSSSGRYGELGQRYGMHTDPTDVALTVEPAAQFMAEHLLAAVIRERLGSEAKGAFLVVAPAQNREAWSAIKAYEQQLITAPVVPFMALTLERIIETVRSAGDTELAQRLHQRYTDFDPVHALIDDWEPFVV